MKYIANAQENVYRILCSLIWYIIIEAHSGDASAGPQEGYDKVQSPSEDEDRNA